VADGKAFNRSKETILANELSMADNFFLRLKGLLFTSNLPTGKGLYIAPCQAIHMMGMVYAIDCVFVDKQGTVVGLCKEVKPWALSPVFGKALGCIELPAGTIDATHTEVGDSVEIIKV